MCAQASISRSPMRLASFHWRGRALAATESLTAWQTLATAINTPLPITQTRSQTTAGLIALLRRVTIAIRNVQAIAFGFAMRAHPLRTLIGCKGTQRDASAMRRMSARAIKNAPRIASAPRASNSPTTPRPNVANSAVVEMIACDVLKDEGGKVHQISHAIAAPKASFVEVSLSTNGSGNVCTLRNVAAPAVNSSAPKTVTVGGKPVATFTDEPKTKITSARSSGPRFPNYDLIGLTSSGAPAANSFALSGEIIDTKGGCLTLRTPDNATWRLSATPPTGALLGKDVIVWGVQAEASCLRRRRDHGGKPRRLRRALVGTIFLVNRLS